MAAAAMEHLEQKFPICLQDREGVLFAHSVQELVQEGSLSRLLDLYGPLIQSKATAATALSFCGWFIGVAVAMQYSLSVWNVAPDFAPEKVIVQVWQADQRFGIAFKIDGWSELAAPVRAEERAGWRNQVLARFYGKTVRPLVEALAKAANVQPAQLWGQFPTAFLYYVDTWCNGEPDAEIQQRVRDDYRSLVNQLDGAVFGRTKNPFDVTIRWIESLESPDVAVRMKTACCLYDCLEGGTNCYTCPRLKEEDRAERRAQYRSAV